MSLIRLLRVWVKIFEPQLSDFASFEPYKFLSRNLTIQNSIILYRIPQHMERLERVRPVLYRRIKIGPSPILLIKQNRENYFSLTIEVL